MASSAPQLLLIADLAVELSRVHSARRLVDVLFASLARHVAATQVVLWYATGDGRGLEVTSSVDGAKAVPSVRPSPGPADVIVPLPDDGGYIAVRCSDRGDVALDVEAWRALAAVVSTTMRHVEVLERVSKLSRRAHVEARELRRRLNEMDSSGDIVAASPSTRRLMREVVPAIARHDTIVLLRGPTGTGKEVLARRIHSLSSRRSRTFVQVNCGAIPETLIESTLFGHERGSFTGAVARHVGVFERAHQGTLLLDEIGDLPLAAQVKLLRVLQSGEIQRVGGERSLAVDVRVIAATHRPLERMVAAGTFREDLYYRISVFPIEVSPLRDRPEDIDALTTAFVARAAARMGRNVPTIPASVRRKLRQHPWPGNVRELQNVIERALVLSVDDELRIPFALAPASGSETEAVERLDTATKRAIERALTASGGRLYGSGGAAALLGLKPSTLQSKMTKLGMTR